MQALAKWLFVIFIMVVVWIEPVSAQNLRTSDNQSAGTEHSEEKFNPGEFIIEHVLDAYDWHIATIGEKHISIPLPVILYSNHPEFHEGKRVNIFMSSKFHHGKNDYRGFRISHDKKFKGRIVELDHQGVETGRPIDLSLTKTIAGVIISVMVLFILLLPAKQAARHNKGRAPSGMHNLIETVIIFIRDEIAKPSIGENKYQKFMPSLLTLFFFILLNNLLGLIPIFPFGANVTGNIAVTLVLALFTFLVTNIRSSKHYWKEMFNPDVPWWLKLPIPLMPILEISGMFTKPLVLMIRLFANMLAGHLIITVFISIIFIFGSQIGPAAGYLVSPVSVLFSAFIMLLDVLISFIQAYVFTLLSAIYFGMATADD